MFCWTVLVCLVFLCQLVTFIHILSKFLSKEGRKTKWEPSDVDFSHQIEVGLILTIMTYEYFRVNNMFLMHHLIWHQVFWKNVYSDVLNNFIRKECLRGSSFYFYSSYLLENNAYENKLLMRRHLCRYDRSNILHDLHLNVYPRLDHSRHFLNRSLELEQWKRQRTAKWLLVFMKG